MKIGEKKKVTNPIKENVRAVIFGGFRGGGGGAEMKFDKLHQRNNRNHQQPKKIARNPLLGT